MRCVSQEHSTDIVQKTVHVHRNSFHVKEGASNVLQKNQIYETDVFIF